MRLSRRYLESLDDWDPDDVDPQDVHDALKRLPEYVHDPDDHTRPGNDAYTDNLRGGY